MNKKIYIRTDANASVASGHLMRCLSIACAIKRLGSDICFIFADSESEVFMEHNNYEYIVLNTKWNDMEGEIEKMYSVIQENSIDFLLVDSYYVTRHYFDSLSKVTKIYYMDDLQREVYPIEGIISYSMGCSERKYKHMYHNQNTKLRIGLQYVPLREEFFDATPIQVKRNISKILITLGGSDEIDITYHILDVIMQSGVCDGLEIHVVIGRLFKNVEQIKKIKKGEQKLIFHENVFNMASLIKKCDLAITAAGTSLFEMSVFGIPVISVAIADNQIRAAERFRELNTIIYAGYYQKNQKEVLDNIVDGVEMMKNESLRKELSERWKKYIDGKGALRIAEELIRYSNFALE